MGITTAVLATTGIGEFYLNLKEDHERRKREHKLREEKEAGLLLFNDSSLN